MDKELFPRNKVFTKAQFDSINKRPVNWSDDKIPPLVKLSSKKEKEVHEEISIQSLNQSEVKSIYTVDREDFDKHVLDIMNSSSSRSHKANINPVVISDQVEVDWETPINQAKMSRNVEREQHRKDLLSTFREEDHDYRQCQAVRLYQQLVEQPLKQKEEAGNTQVDWIKSKSPSQLLTNVLTNPSRMNVYVRYLLNQIYKNDEAKLINDLYEEEIKPYNPNLNETYNNILCLLGKVGKVQELRERGEKRRSRSKGKARNSSPLQSPKVSLFQNGLSIDLYPKLNEAKRQKAAKIRQLTQQNQKKEQELQQIKRHYGEILINYAVSIEQLHKHDEDKQKGGSLRPQLKQSMVKLDVQEEEEEQVRKKHHTFGMKMGSVRESKQSRR